MNLRLPAAVITGGLAIATALVVKWEPARDRYTAYPDVGNTWTICDGHTRGVYPGMKATPAQCDAWRGEDLAIAIEPIAQCITAPLTANQLGALIDGTYNVGPKLVCGSTLQRKANAGDMRGACKELGRWITAAKRPMRGLINRRADEMAICWPDFSNVQS